MNQHLRTNDVLIEKPYPALCVKNRIFRENVFGIVKRLRFFIRHIEEQRKYFCIDIKDTKILDIGCGTGINVSIPLASIGYSVTGLDSDAATIDRAIDTARGLPNIEFRNETLNSNYGLKTFHIVICSEVLEHQQNPSILFKQINNVLKDEGLLMLTVPNGYGYFEWEELILKYFLTLNKLTDEVKKNIVKLFGSKKMKLRFKEEGRPEHWKLARTTLATGSHHFQHFKLHKLEKLFAYQNFKVIALRNTSLLSGRVMNNILRDCDRIISLNCKTADFLPSILCSGWMIVGRKVHHG